MKKLIFTLRLFVFLQTVSFMIPTFSIAQKIACGGQHSLFLCSDSIVNCWGWNLLGQLGNGTNASTNLPVEVTALNGIRDVGAGVDHSVALKNDWDCVKVLIQ